MRNRSFIAPITLSVLLLGAVIWGYNQYQVKLDYETALDNHYQMLFYDVKSHVDDVEVGLSKALLANTDERKVLLLSQIVTNADAARYKMGQFPVSHVNTTTTEKFLTQASDYSYFLIQRVLEEEEITRDQREALMGIQLNTQEFNQELQALADSIMEDNFLLGMASLDEEAMNQHSLVTSLVNHDQEIAKSPELIYDGPFADQMINREPLGLGDNIVEIEEARKIAQEFMGEEVYDEILEFEIGEDFQETRIPTYTFELANGNGSKFIGITRQGGKVINMQNPRGVSEKNLSIEEGQEAALEYLASQGFENMEPNYYLQYNGTVLYNFAYTENDMTIYPDLVKVKIALDNGEVVGLDAGPYYLNHHDRDFPEVKVEIEDARKVANGDMEIESERLALIPKGENESLCYEFKGIFNEEEYIVYVNAETGREEQILQLIQTENGTLTF